MDGDLDISDVFDSVVNADFFTECAPIVDLVVFNQGLLGLDDLTIDQIRVITYFVIAAERARGEHD